MISDTPSENAAPIPSEAERARVHSEAARDEAIKQWGPVHQVTNTLREHRKNNHFAELLGDIFKS